MAYAYGCYDANLTQASSKLTSEQVVHIFDLNERAYFTPLVAVSTPIFNFCHTMMIKLKLTLHKATMN